MNKRLDESFNEDDVDSAEDIDESRTDDPRDEVPPGQSEPVPGDPPSRLAPPVRLISDPAQKGSDFRSWNLNCFRISGSLLKTSAFRRAMWTHF